MRMVQLKAGDGFAKLLRNDDFEQNTDLAGISVFLWMKQGSYALWRMSFPKDGLDVLADEVRQFLAEEMPGKDLTLFADGHVMRISLMNEGTGYSAVLQYGESVSAGFVQWSLTETDLRELAEFAERRENESYRSSY